MMEDLEKMPLFIHKMMIEGDFIVYFEKLDDWEKSVYVVTIDDERDDHWFQKLADWKNLIGDLIFFNSE